MSRVGKQPIALPDKTTVAIDGKQITVKGPKGELIREIHPDMTAGMEENQLVVTRPSDQKKHRALHGLTRALLHNMVVGVSEGYRRELKIIGVGYRAEVRGKMLVMSLGYSHPVLFAPPESIKVSVMEKENIVIVEGIDKELVGAVAAKIRSFRKPEPYKGKGVRYIDEKVRTKAGKAAGSGA